MLPTPQHQAAILSVSLTMTRASDRHQVSGSAKRFFSPRLPILPDRAPIPAPLRPLIAVPPTAEERRRRAMAALARGEQGSGGAGERGKVKKQVLFANDE
jgi:hypothetical protein